MLNVVTTKDRGGEDQMKSTPKEKDASTATPTRKRKASKVERALDDVITKFTAAQKASEERFFEIEQKRLKQEMELEEKRMALEDKRRKQELDHERRLMVMMTQMISRIFSTSCATT